MSSYKEQPHMITRALILGREQLSGRNVGLRRAFNAQQLRGGGERTYPPGTRFRVFFPGNMRVINRSVDEQRKRSVAEQRRGRRIPGFKPGPFFGKIRNAYKMSTGSSRTANYFSGGNYWEAIYYGADEVHLILKLEMSKDKIKKVLRKDLDYQRPYLDYNGDREDLEGLTDNIRIVRTRWSWPEDEQRRRNQRIKKKKRSL